MMMMMSGMASFGQYARTDQERAACIVSKLDQLFHWARAVEPYAGTFIVIIAISGQ